VVATSARLGGTPIQSATDESLGGQEDRREEEGKVFQVVLHQVLSWEKGFEALVKGLECLIIYKPWTALIEVVLAASRAFASNSTQRHRKATRPATKLACVKVGQGYGKTKNMYNVRLKHQRKTLTVVAADMVHGFSSVEDGTVEWPTAVNLEQAQGEQGAQGFFLTVLANPPK